MNDYSSGLQKFLKILWGITGDKLEEAIRVMALKFFSTIFSAFSDAFLFYGIGIDN